MGSRRTKDIPADRRAASAARREVVAALDEWALVRMRDDVELVVSELITNAVRYAPGDSTHQLRIIRQPTGVRLEITDSSPAPPVIAPLDAERPGGHGLRIVETLSSAWGFAFAIDGKVVWAELDERRPA